MNSNYNIEWTLMLHVVAAKKTIGSWSRLSSQNSLSQKQKVIDTAENHKTLQMHHMAAFQQKFDKESTSGLLLSVHTRIDHLQT